jgi:hypothetical protein
MNIAGHKLGRLVGRAIVGSTIHQSSVTRH